MSRVVPVTVDLCRSWSPSRRTSATAAPWRSGRAVAAGGLLGIPVDLYGREAGKIKHLAYLVRAGAGPAWTSAAPPISLVQPRGQPPILLRIEDF